ncbi:AEC family transporter [Alkaliphilus serpentinus]|uniref:AEC family transporter n=1 Tax=Alkaliphilus serpentinus TaxID=1482731 RepID=A0A833HLV9_9FIRM|nr:AEC family transporter [Alkaliphilus serpentinus]KAB3526655.1 AEC family transporter [Alkaliphilus serpentinus]
MSFIAVFNEIAILFLLVLVGYLARKRNFINDEVNKGLSALILQFTLPALIIKSMQFSFSKEVLVGSLHIILLSLFVHGFSILVAFISPYILKVKGAKKDIYQFILIFSNVGYMGYPILFTLYGEIGVFYGALFNIPFNVLLWTLGVVIISRNSNKTVEGINYKKVLLNPGIIAVVIGFFLFISSIEIPYILFKTLDLLGNTTTPLSMLLIGGMLAELPVKEVFREEKILGLSFIRLIFIPFAVYTVLKLLRIDDFLLGVSVVIAAMPAAVNTAVLASIFDVEPYVASKGVFITTLLSLLTIPLLTFIL